MSLVVRQVDHPTSGKVIHTYKATLEPDGSLDTTQIAFLRKGDAFVVSLQDYLSALEKQKTIMSHAGKETLQISSMQTDKSSSRSTIKPPNDVYRPKDPDHAPRRIYMLPRRISTTSDAILSDTSTFQTVSELTSILIRQHRDLDDPSSILNSWEINLEYDFSLDTSKFTTHKPEDRDHIPGLDPSKVSPKELDDPYYVRGSNGKYFTLNINGDPLVSPSYLEYYLQELPGIAIPVLQITSNF
ncbi:hypothetical protein H0H93_005097 [Arthromyces matolae]|nr:hypothetical protein H0H93_005097 [Arthromyces matolae]